MGFGDRKKCIFAEISGDSSKLATLWCHFLYLSLGEKKQIELQETKIHTNKFFQVSCISKGSKILVVEPPPWIHNAGQKIDIFDNKIQYISKGWTNGIWTESENQWELPNFSKPQSSHMLCSVSVMRPNWSVGDRRKARRTRNETLFNIGAAQPAAENLQACLVTPREMWSGQSGETGEMRKTIRE